MDLGRLTGVSRCSATKPGGRACAAVLSSPRPRPVGGSRCECGVTPPHTERSEGRASGDRGAGARGNAPAVKICVSEANTDNGSPKGWSKSERGGGPPSDTKGGAGDPARRTPRKGGGGDSPQRGSPQTYPLGRTPTNIKHSGGGSEDPQERSDEDASTPARKWSPCPGVRGGSPRKREHTTPEGGR